MNANGTEFPPVIFISGRFNLKGVRSELRGILDYAQKHGPWRCLLHEGRDDEQLLRLKHLTVAGVIASGLSRRDAARIAALHVPVVLYDPPPEMLAPGQPLAAAPYVKMDSYGVGAMAAEYYLKRGYTTFAYVGETLGTRWSAERCQGFAAALKKAGSECIVYDVFSKRECRNWDAERPRMIRFLRKLPKPAAIFAGMDNRARLVLDACAEAKIEVPEEIAVLGVDNDPILCESTVPSLSSIRTGGFRRGQKAAEMMDALLHGKSIQKKNVVMEPLAVVTRESTGYDAMRNPILARALRFIHAHAARDSIDVADVVQAAGCSRRYVEKLFRAQLHASVRDLVLQTKFAQVRTLLEDSSLSIGEIAERCRFANANHLAVLFKKTVGLSMSDYRKRNRELSDE